jgi:hypothetical protein
MASGSLAEALGQLVAGATAGVTATFITNPLDTMKVESQKGGMSPSQMIQRPGLLWRGITVVLIESESAARKCSRADAQWILCAPQRMN